MTERPILFTASMVRAILAGTKTQTRRLIKWQGPKNHPHFFDRAFTDNPAGVRRLCVPHHHPQDRDLGSDNPCHRHYPQWEKGDRLWVKETWAADDSLDLVKPSDLDAGIDVEYFADNGRRKPGRSFDRGRTRVSIFMPRWASRLTLEVTEEPIPQRLQDISDGDVVAEGLDLINGDRHKQDAYAELWNNINGQGSWEQNPWVWVISFRRLP